MAITECRTSAPRGSDRTLRLRGEPRRWANECDVVAARTSLWSGRGAKNDADLDLPDSDPVGYRNGDEPLHHLPDHHSGAHPSNYFTGSVQSISWSLTQGAIILAIHVVFGFALVVLVVTASLRTARLHRRIVTIWSALGALLVIGAGFNGASFLDFNNNISSLIMPLLALASVASYGVVLFLLNDSMSHRS